MDLLFQAEIVGTTLSQKVAGCKYYHWDRRETSSLIMGITLIYDIVLKLLEQFKYAENLVKVTFMPMGNTLTFKGIE